jgi:hypothetical protein
MTGFQSKRAMSEDGWVDPVDKNKRYQYWQMLRRAHNDYIKLTEQAGIAHELGSGAFEYYLKQTYGIQTELIDGHITAHYVILDEKKYTMFLLKYS